MMFECIDKVYPSVSIDTVTGSIVSFNDEYGGLPLKSCSSLISGYQEGSGTPSPSNVRPLHAWSEINMGMVNWNQLINYSSSVTCPANEDHIYMFTDTTKVPFIANHKYLALYNQKTTMTSNLRNGLIYNDGSGYKYMPNMGENSHLTAGIYSWIFSPTNTTNNGTFGLWINRPDIDVTYDDIQLFDITAMFDNNIADYLYSLETQTTEAGVALFKQIFYKDYYVYNAGGVLVSAASVNGDTYPPHATVQIGQSIYQGSIDWKRGVVTETWGYIASYNGETLTGEWLCNKEPYEVGTTPPTGSQVAYELATPIEIPLGGIQLLTQEGQNNIFCDTGDTTVEYIKIV